MYLIDTNVISEVRKQSRVGWIGAFSTQHLSLSALGYEKM